MDDVLHNGILSVISDYTKQTGLSCVFCPTLNTKLESEMQVNTSCQLCRLIQTSREGMEGCIKQRRSMVVAAFQNYTSQISICHARLLEWIAPVFYKGKAVGYFASGFLLSTDVNLREQERERNACAARFGLDPMSTQIAMDTLMSVPTANVLPLADLLFSLIRLNIPSGRQTSERTDRETLSQANFLVGTEPASSALPEVFPLTHYICGENISRAQLATFWKSVEVKATDIFMNTMSGRFTEAQDAYDQLMEMCYREESLEETRAGAEMLFHITTLKFYNQTLFDTRFYRLTFETISGLFAATTVREIQEVMDSSLRTIYQFFNVNQGRPEPKTVSKTIMNYLEKHYAEDIKISDIEKVTYMSSSYVSRLFKKETSLTIKACLINIRMRHAQELIVNTNMMIKDVAEAVGYPDIRGFYKMFLKHFGITCSEMRRSRVPTTPPPEFRRD